MNDPFRYVRLIGALCLGAVLPLASNAAPPHCGIQGRTHVYIGPILTGPPPWIVPAVVRLFPVATTFKVVSAQSGRLVARGSSDANGDFKLPLPPGRYVVVPDELPNTLFCMHQTPEPFEVTVQPHSFSGAGFTYLATCHLNSVGVP